MFAKHIETQKNKNSVYLVPMLQRGNASLPISIDVNKTRIAGVVSST